MFGGCSAWTLSLIKDSHVYASFRHILAHSSGYEWQSCLCSICHRVEQRAVLDCTSCVLANHDVASSCTSNYSRTRQGSLVSGKALPPPTVNIAARGLHTTDEWPLFLISVGGGSWGKITLRRLTTWFFRGFLQSLQPNSWGTSSTMPLLRASKTFPINYLSVLLFDAVSCNSVWYKPGTRGSYPAWDHL
jgi:hypothetical protein